jgi:hypothetical protein
MEERFNVTVYLFDVKNRRAYQSNGNQDNYKRVTESLFGEITATTVSSTLPQEGPASGAATAATVTALAIPVSTPSESLPNTVMVPAQSQPQLQRLPASEMRGLISGNTVSGKSERGSDFHVYHSPDGKMSGQARLAYYDVGTWEITDDGKYCRRWTNWREGARDCFEMFEVGEDRLRIKAINYHYDDTFRIREGDPQNLKWRI